MSKKNTDKYRLPSEYYDTSPEFNGWTEFAGGVPEDPEKLPEHSEYPEFPFEANEENCLYNEDRDDRDERAEKSSKIKRLLSQWTKSAFCGGTAILAILGISVGLTVSGDGRFGNPEKVVSLLQPAVSAESGIMPQDIADLWNGEVDALHDYGEEYVKAEPSCLEKGEVARVCRICGVERIYETGGGSHVGAEPVKENVSEATCSRKGGYDSVVYCAVCADEISRTRIETDMTAHIAGEPVTENRVDAGCTEAGSFEEAVYCTECRAELSRRKTDVPAAGHTPGRTERNELTKADCTHDGQAEEITYCAVCLKEYERRTVTLPASGAHTAADPVTENTVPSTCTEKGRSETVVYCGVCGAEISRTVNELELLEHTPADPVNENTVPSTCTKHGSSETVVYCADCGAELSRNVNELKLLDHKAGTASAENRKSATCTEAATYHNVVRCTECGTVLSDKLVTSSPALGHSFTPADNWITPDDAVCKCDLCGTPAITISYNSGTDTVTGTVNADFMKIVTDHGYENISLVICMDYGGDTAGGVYFPYTGKNTVSYKLSDYKHEYGDDEWDWDAAYARVLVEAYTDSATYWDSLPMVCSEAVLVRPDKLYY